MAPTPDPSDKKEVPIAVIVLVVGAIVSQSMVLSGNLSTAAAINGLGTTTKGWSETGMGISSSMKKTLQEKVHEVETKLTGTIDTLQSVLDMVTKVMPNQTGTSLDKTKESLLQAAALAGGPPVGLLQGGGALGGEHLEQSRLAAEYGIKRAVEVGDANLQVIVKKIMGELDDMLKGMMKGFKPALQQAGKWMESFSEPIQNGIETLGNTIDKAQKMIDQVMSGASKAGPGAADIERETFNLFDASDTGTISVDDLQAVSKVYSIQALQSESKCKEMVEKYDKDNDTALNHAEFKGFAEDPSLPKITVTVLRQYAKKLQDFAGKAQVAKTRIHVAEAVVSYIQLVSSKNMTKVGWVAEALSSKLPTPFVADVLQKLAEAKDDPDCPTTADVGEIMESAMAKINLKKTSEIVLSMSNVSAWEEEGKDPKAQEQLVEQVDKWLTEYLKSKKGQEETSKEDRDDVLGKVDKAVKDMQEKVGVSALETLASKGVFLFQEEAAGQHTLTSQEELELLEELPRKLKELRRQAVSELFLRREEEFNRHFISEHQRVIYDQFLMAMPSDDPASAAVASEGVPALPVTLHWVDELQKNATETAKRFEQMNFNHTSESGSPIDSFATNVETMLKKVVSFLKMIKTYATPQGIQNIEDTISDFVEKGQAELMKFLREQMASLTKSSAMQVLDEAGQGRVEALLEQLVAGEGHGEEAMRVPRHLVQEYIHGQARSDGEEKEEGELLRLPRYPAGCEGTCRAPLAPGSELTAERVMTGTGLVANREAVRDLQPAPSQSQWQLILRFINMLKPLLPAMINILRFAKTAVGSLSTTLGGLFEQLKKQGPAIFDQVGSIYRMAWTGYFTFFLILLLAQLFYAFWAGGFFGGPKPDPEESGYQPHPAIYYLKRVCCCLDGRKNDTSICMWSIIILMQLLCLIIFIVAILLCVLAGIEAFVAFGCEQIHILGEAEVCGSAIETINNILETLEVEGLSGDWKNVCMKLEMNACQFVSQRMHAAVMPLIAGGLLCVFFHWHLIVMQAKLHERVRQRRENYRVFKGLPEYKD